MASNGALFLVAFAMACVAIPMCGSLPQSRQQIEELNDVEMVAKKGKPYSGWNPARSRRRFTSPPAGGAATNDTVDPEDFTMTGNPAMDTSIISTIGSIASTLIKTLFGRGGGDDRAREGGGFMGFVSSLFCRIFGGLFKPSGAGETCSSAGSDADALPANLTSQQMKMIEDYKEAMYDY